MEKNASRAKTAKTAKERQNQRPPRRAAFELPLRSWRSLRE